MKSAMTLTAGVLLLSLLPATPAAAKHWHDRDRHGRRGEAACYFRPDDVRIIRTYYEPSYRRLPPGLAKKYYRTGHLPPGWAKRMQPLPVEIERQLVVLPPEYRRGYIDGSVVVYTPRAQVIVDVVPVFGR